MTFPLAAGWKHLGCVDRALRECDPQNVPALLTKRFVVTKWVIGDPEMPPYRVRGLLGQWRVNRDHLDRLIRHNRGELLTPTRPSSWSWFRRTGDIEQDSMLIAGWCFSGVVVLSILVTLWNWCCGYRG